ncbi:hypothetical protein LCGC14_2971790 [marine sediment metagenome]|uniref:Uncharacterized protein n=1 Tax=marine sediment metagenome TaxID=412755 RepID=A0A0F8XA40_9ZZZZ
MRRLSIPEQHELKIARNTLKLPPGVVEIMGGPTVEQAKAAIKRLAGS